MNKKVYPSEILEILKSQQRCTRSYLAEAFGCSQVTISLKIRELRECGEKIYFDKDGFFLLDKIRDNEEHESIKLYGEWIIKTVAGVLKCGDSLKPLLQQSKEYLKLNMNAEERKELKKAVQKINGLLEYASLDDDY